MPKTARRLFAVFSCLTFSFPVFSAESLQPVVVTATRTAQTVDETLAPVSIVSSEDIERLQAQSVQEVFQSLPGVHIASNGGAGQPASIFLRGSESDHVLVMINGIKIGSVTTGGAAFQNIPVDQIERIEIVRGPRSSIYGSEAIGGVIQIFTKKGLVETTPEFSIGAGSFDSVKATAGISGSAGLIRYNLNLTHENTAGFDTCQGNLTAGCFADEPDDDGFDNTSGSLRVGSKFGNSGEWDFHLLHAEGSNEFDGSIFSGNESDVLEQVFGGTIRFSPLEKLHISLNAGQNRDDSDIFFNGATNSHFNTKRKNASLQGDLLLRGDNVLTAGIDYQDDSIESSTAYDVTSRNNSGAFIQYLAKIGTVDMQLSLRGDDNEQFGNHGTGGLAISHVHNNGWRVTASAGTAYKAPTFNELYFPGFSNQDLSPEKSVSYELGVNNGSVGEFQWSANLFQTEITDLIAFDATTFAIDNIEEARIRGLETEIRTSLGGWSINANATLLDPVNNGNTTNKGNVLPRRAKQSLRVDLDHDFGKFRLGGTLIATGERFDNLANSNKMPGYGTIDLRAEYSLNPSWLLQASIANLFDKDYQTAQHYNQAGRNFFLTLRYRPAR